MGRYHRFAVKFIGTLLLASLLFTGACTRPRQQPEAVRPSGATISIAVPLGLPPLQVPPDNPPTAASVALGEKLFFSPLLSLDKTISCASCHDPKHAFANDQAMSKGVGGKLGARNAPTVLNAAYNRSQFWDGRAASLEAQASGPMMNPVEMVHTVEGVEKAVANDTELNRLYQQAFGAAPVSLELITKALASYERTLLRANSPFDRYEYGHKSSALNPSAQRGLALFRGSSKGNCTACHLIGEKDALFSDGLFHNLGVGMSPEGDLRDLGRYDVTHREADKGTFRTPGLRNVALTAPYMHDGSLKTLKDVIDFYVGGGNGNPNLDKRIKPLTFLTRQERADLVAFLESLTGEASR